MAANKNVFIKISVDSKQAAKQTKKHRIVLMD